MSKQECDSCGFKTKLREYPRSPCEKGEPHNFCEVCAATFLSHPISYPRLYGDQHHLFSSIGYLGNMLLEEIRSLKTRLGLIQGG